MLKRSTVTVILACGDYSLKTLTITHPHFYQQEDQTSCLLPTLKQLLHDQLQPKSLVPSTSFRLYSPTSHTTVKVLESKQQHHLALGVWVGTLYLIGSQLFFHFCLFNSFVWDQVSLLKPRCPQIHNPPASATSLSEFLVCMKKPSFTCLWCKRGARKTIVKVSCDPSIWKAEAGR